jgi:hypothetical protein
LGEVHEDVELELVRLSSRRYDTLTILTIPSLAVGLNRFAASTPKVESKRVLPLLREAFRIDIIVPQHRRGYERLWHSAACKLEIRETRVTEICLTHKDSVVAFCEWAARWFPSESHVR